MTLPDADASPDADTLNAVREVVADVLGLRVELVTPDLTSEGHEAWDSVQHLNIVVALEERFGVELEPEDIDKMRSVRRIAGVVAARRAAG